MTLHSFWREHPALLLALSFCIGTSSFLFWETPWNFLFPLLWSLYLIYLRRPLLLLSLVGSIVYAAFLYGSAPILENPKQLEVFFSIHSIQSHHSPFHKGLLYKGEIYLKEGIFPCSIYHRGIDPPKATHDYFIQGTLKQRGPYDYSLSPKKWIPRNKNWKLVELRHQMKESLRKFLKKNLSAKSAMFLGSLITGDVEDRQLRYDFGRLGLQHILAISGFHFGVLIAFCSFFLSFAFSRFWKYVILIAAINIYFIFIGALPAVQRSWLTAGLYLCAKLFHRQTTGLNLLGCAMLLELCLNPLVSANIGFQLSFLSCAGILILHPVFEKALRIWLPKRTPDEIGELSYFSKHGCLFSSILRQALSLTLSVNCTILPVLLYHFHQFPLLGLFYNLFFPFLVSAALFMLLLSLSCQLLFPLLTPYLFSLTDWITTQLLNLASHPPLQLDYSLWVTSFPAWIIPFYLFILFSVPILTNRDFYRKILVFCGGRSSVG